MQKIKLIAVDLDGTALDDRSRLTERTKKVLEQAAEQGIYLAAASGRAYSSLPEEVMKLKGLTCAITSNGAATYDPKNGERLFSFLLEGSKVEEILEYLEGEPETAIEVFLEGEPYAGETFLQDPERYGVPARAVSYLQKTRTPCKDICAFVRKHKDSLDALDIICQGPLDKAEWVEKLDKIEGIYVTSSTPYRLEISGGNSGKGAALKEMSYRLGVKPEEIIAFGNADNDVDMLGFAGFGVAVANSPQSVQRYADRIAPSNTEEGVAQVLEEILFKS